MCLTEAYKMFHLLLSFPFYTGWWTEKFPAFFFIAQSFIFYSFPALSPHLDVFQYVLLSKPSCHGLFNGSLLPCSKFCCSSQNPYSIQPNLCNFFSIFSSNLNLIFLCTPFCFPPHSLKMVMQWLIALYQKWSLNCSYRWPPWYDSGLSCRIHAKQIFMGTVFCSMKSTSFWSLMLYSLVESTNILDKCTASIFGVEEQAT